MSFALYRLGRFAAARPWTVIGTWLIVAVVVIVSSVTFGKELENTFSVPGLDSSEAIDLLSSVQSDRAGLTAQIVMTPADGSTFLSSPELLQDVARISEAAASLPNVLDTSIPAGALDGDPATAMQAGALSPDGSIALVRLQYPVREELSVDDLENAKELLDDVRADSALTVEGGGDLFFAFEQPETGVGEMIGLIAAVIILLVAFGSVIAMGLPIGMALFGLALGISSMSLVTYLIEIPDWAPQMASMVGLGVGIDYASSPSVELLLLRVKP